MDQRKFEDLVKFTRGHFKRTVERYKTYYGMFRGKIKGGERKGMRWIGKEQVSKNRGDTKGQLHVKQLLVSILIQTPHLITATSQLNSLLNELCECAPCSPCGHDPLANFKFAGPS